MWFIAVFLILSTLLPSQLGLNESLLNEEKRKIGDNIKRKEENENEIIILTKAQRGSLRQVISENYLNYAADFSAQV